MDTKVDPWASSALHEGYTMRALPIFTVPSILHKIPTEQRPIRFQLDRSLAKHVYESVDSYNHNLKLVKQPGDLSVWEPSAKVVEQAMKINEVVQRAYNEINMLSAELQRNVQIFTESVPLGDHHFRDGTWACE